MAYIQHTYICSFLLAIIIGDVFLFTEGRQLKELKNQKSDSFEDKGLRNYGKEPTGSKQIPAGHKGDVQVTGPIPSYHVSGAKEFFPPMSSIGPNPSPEFGSSLTSFANGFQPTTPGKSPGVGHSYVGRKEENTQKSLSNSLSVAHSLGTNANDFRPTGPGRSPGVGHSYQTTEPNV